MSASNSVSPAAAHLEFRPPTERDRQLLFQQAVLGLAAVIVVLGRNAMDSDTAGFYIGAAICVLAMLPLIVWARTMAHNYPFFEIFMATNLAAYGVPLMSEHEIVTLFDERIRDQAGLAVILFQVVAIATFYGVRTRPKRTPFWRQPVFSNVSHRWVIVGLIVSTVYVVAVTFLYAPPPGVAGILRAVFFGIGSGCTFIAGVAWGLHHLKRSERGIVVACIIVQFVVTSAGLVLRTGVSIVVLALVGFFFGARRLPYLAVALTLVLCAILNLGKYDLRAQYWRGDEKTSPRLADLPDFYVNWFSAGLAPKEKADTKAGELLLERNSLLQMLCLVMSLTPDPLPHLDGLTYQDTLGQFVPRFLWPDKPRGHVSTYTLSIYYGLQDEESTGTTTIAFGLLPEGFANFGFLGMVLLGIFFGGAFKWVVVSSRDSPILSYAGLAIILLTAWSFQAELTFSIWITSLAQAVVSVLGFVYVFRRARGLA